MSRVKRASHLLALVDDSDSEDGLSGNTFGIPRQPQKQQQKQQISTVASAKQTARTMPPAKRGTRAGQPANKVVKPESNAATRRTSGRKAAAVEKALVDKTNTLPAAAKAPAARGRKRAAATEKETEDVTMEDSPEPSMAAATPPAADAAKSRGTRGRPKKAALEDVVEEVPDSQPTTTRRGRRGAAAKKADESIAVEERSEIPETQQPEEQNAEEEEAEEQEDLEDLPAPRARNVSASPAKRPFNRISSSSIDGGGGDPALRRRLGEMTQKYENMELKYRDLREIAVKEAEKNFDKLRKQGEEKAKAADKLIASLKSELATQREASKETERLRKQLEASEAEVETLRASVKQLNTSLSESKQEIKALNMKLSASRTAEAAAAAKAVPGSAMKASRMMGNSEAMKQATMTHQMKENLYGDLTGLIVRGVKHEGGNEVFDCIQTGRNGTLHFKLSVSADASEGNYDEVEIEYQPQLDENRDQALIQMLPEYLSVDISFPRQHANKFYARLMKALTEG